MYLDPQTRRAAWDSRIPDEATLQCADTRSRALAHALGVVVGTDVIARPDRRRGPRGRRGKADHARRRPLVAHRCHRTLSTKLKTYTAPTVLVIDDVGLLPIGGTEGAAMFFHVVNTRYGKGHPTLVTTNRGLPAWGQIIGDAVVAAAILDRLMHKAIVFNIRGPSWRLREHNGLEIATTNPNR